MLSIDYVTTTSGSNKDRCTSLDTLFHCSNLISFTSCLESIDGINFCNNNASTKSSEGLSRALANITIASYNTSLAANIISVALLIPSVKDS